jgi:hypothetical protein
MILELLGAARSKFLENHIHSALFACAGRSQCGFQRRLKRAKEVLKICRSESRGLTYRSGHYHNLFWLKKIKLHAETHIWRLGNAVPLPWSFRKSSSTVGLTATVGQGRWRIWEQLVRTPCS